MIFNETLNTAIIALNLNKVRAALTMLGVIIGVFAVVEMIAIGNGLQNYIKDQFEAIGSNLLFVSPGRVDLGEDPSKYMGRNRLEDKHIDLIKKHASDIPMLVSGFVNVGETVKYKNKSFYANIIGATYDAKDIYNYEIDIGRFFNKPEEKNKEKVAILGPEVIKELFPNADPLEQKIKVGNHTYKIIGTFKRKGSNFDDGVIIPYTSALDSFNLTYLSSIVVKVQNSEDVEKAARSIELALRRDLKEDEFTVLSQTDILSSIQNILQIVTLALGAIAGISLIVGGIGIMNIMFVSVTERTREIGLRKALGASPFNIGFQFLIESVLLSVGGGIIGLTLGWLVSIAASKAINIRATIDFLAVVLAFGFAAAVGVIFGTYPAYKAAKKTPVEALRYE